MYWLAGDIKEHTHLSQRAGNVAVGSWSGFVNQF